jgi:hypothetical protein
VPDRSIHSMLFVTVNHKRKIILGTLFFSGVVVGVFFLAGAPRRPSDLPVADTGLKYDREIIATSTKLGLSRVGMFLDKPDKAVVFVPADWEGSYTIKEFGPLAQFVYLKDPSMPVFMEISLHKNVRADWLAPAGKTKIWQKGAYAAAYQLMASSTDPGLVKMLGEAVAVATTFDLID